MGLRERRPGQLAALRGRIERLTSAGFQAELAQTMAAAATKQVADEFAGERDPYGRHWQPLARGTRPAAKRAHAKILRKTGRMAASAVGVPAARSFTMHIAWPAPIHQHGAFVAPHSRVGGHEVRRNEKTGAYAKRGARSYTVEHAGHSTFAAGIVIPQRMLVPTRAAGGLGPIWLTALNREAVRLVRLRLGKAAH